MMKEKIRIIINPISGKRKGKIIAEKIKSHSGKFDVEIKFTENRGHASLLAKEAADQNYYAVVAVGGDGTVNEVASSLLNTETSLAVIPAGSGNGLARHLKFSTDPVKVLKQIASSAPIKIDAIKINDRISVNVSGFGFDGYVAWLFDHYGKRGLSSYTTLALREYSKYPEVNFTLKIDGIPFKKNAHMVVIANASQFGNAAIIAPAADLSDGLMDIILVSKPPLYFMPVLLFRLFTGRLKSDRYTSMYKGKTVTVKADQPVHLHIDGEPSEPVNEITCTMLPGILRIIN